LRLPDDFAGIAIERDHAHIVGGDEDLVAVHRDAAVGARLGDLGIIAPERHRFGAAADVEFHHPVVSIGHIHEAVIDQWGRLLLAREGAAGGAAADREDEFELQVLDGVAIDVLERRMAGIVVVAVNREPILRLGRRVEQALWRDVGGQGGQGDGRQANRCQCSEIAFCGHELPPLV
jgi:hypothetical protein